jgi:dipeptidase D
MSYVFEGLTPEKVWKYFYDICQIPHPSKKEGKIIQYLNEFGKTHNLETRTDDAGNVLICKKATSGLEKKKTVVLQSHMDMVCEKNSDVQLDFDKDPIKPWIDKGWVKATGTTLGADDGIGVASALAILASDDIAHGPIECLFTVDEETGLTGAFALKPGFLKGKILLNLDSEDEGELFIGCAGGKGTIIEMKFKKEAVPANHDAYKISVTGLNGGHSGGDIHKGLGNAVKILNRLLWNATDKFGIRISDFIAGNLHNAIAREGFASVAVPHDKSKEFESFVTLYNITLKEELASVDPGLVISFENTAAPAFVIDTDTQYKLLNSLYACPHGVIAMCADIPDLVETSTNLASVKFKDDKIIIGTSQRSSVESSKNDIADMVASVFRLTNAEIIVGDGYPGWKPNVNSEILTITKNAYQKLFNKQPKVLAIHAGLECGIIGETNPGMDMISFGPTLRDVHSPAERIEIATVDMFWVLMLEVLKNIPEA